MKKQLRNTFYVLLASALGILLASQFHRPAFAQEPTPSDDDVNAIARQLYCPVCENTPLDVCPTEACRQWRALIRQQLSDGWTEDQIKGYFVENYGARVLAEPPRAGLNWVIYVLPPAIILTGALVLLRALRSWTKASKAAAAFRQAHDNNPGGSDAQPVQDEYVARLEEELRKRK